MSGHSDELTKLRMNFVERVDSLTGKVTSQHQEVTSLRSQLTLLEMAAAKNVMELQQRLERIFDEMPTIRTSISPRRVPLSHHMT
jgi:chromosome segregation ATPase